jgi:uncharacterized transporter YbjL
LAGDSARTTGAGCGAMTSTPSLADLEYPMNYHNNPERK